MARPVNILFTSAGRRVELLRAFRAAYGTLGIPGRIVVTDIDPLAPSAQVADRVYLVPRGSEPGYVPAIIEICRRENIAAVFPLIDPDIPILARNRAAIEATGARVGVIPEVVVPVVDDKLETVKFFARLGLPVPKSWVPEEIDPERATYPLFIKPRRGSASEHTFKVRSAKELRFFAEYVPNPIVQELLQGPEITNDVVCDLDGRVLTVTSRQRIAVRGGEVAKGVTIHDERITEACLLIARELQAIGPITVQCMMKDGVPHFTEINARFGGGIPLAVAAGADSPRWLIARIAGLPDAPPPVGSYQAGLYMTRCDQSWFLTEADLAQIGRNRF